MKYIFLDVDGVLNSRQYLQNPDYWGKFCEIDYSKVNLLAEIVQATGAEIILCSTWRKFRGVDPHYTYLKMMLGHADLHIVDHTPYLDFDRPLEIYTWLQEQKQLPEAFVILDDDFAHIQYDVYGLADHLVRTKLEYGLQPKHRDMAIQILNGTEG